MVELLVDCQNTLGEGIQWSVSKQRLFWTDIQEKKLYCCDEFGGDLTIFDLPERLCSFAFDPDGNLLAAFASGLYRYKLATGDRDLLLAFEPDKEGTRLNDGRCDRAGRFIVGGYNEAGPEPISSVLSFANGLAKVLFKDVKCANGLCFSPNGSVMYFTDTATREIVSFSYDQASGVLSNKQSFAILGDDEGSPDGSCVDAEGGVWNAQFRGGRVQRFLADGSRDIRIDLPVPNATCVCFGGCGLNKLYISTARHKMTEDQLQQYPLSGGVFVVQPGQTGLVEDIYKSSLF